MGLTPGDIQGKRFHDAFRGYNHEEVDVFLDEVAIAFEAASRDVAAAHARTEELEAQLFELKGTEGMLKRTLLAAQRASDEAIAEAKTEAERLVSSAQDEAAAILAAARQQVDDMATAAAARQSLFEEFGSRLQDLHTTYVAAMRAHLEEQLQALDRLPAPPDPVPAASSTEEPRPVSSFAPPGSPDFSPGDDEEAGQEPVQSALQAGETD